MSADRLTKVMEEGAPDVIVHYSGPILSNKLGKLMPLDGSTETLSFIEGEDFSAFRLARTALFLLADRNEGMYESDNGQYSYLTENAQDLSDSVDALDIPERYKKTLKEAGVITCKDVMDIPHKGFLSIPGIDGLMIVELFYTVKGLISVF